MVAIDAKRRQSDGGTETGEPIGWEVYTHGGRRPTGTRCRGVGRKDGSSTAQARFCFTSMDCDGQKDGYDIELTRAVSDALQIPVIASGGAGTLAHIVEAFTEGRRGRGPCGLYIPLRRVYYCLRPRSTLARRAWRSGLRLHLRTGPACCMKKSEGYLKLIILYKTVMGVGELILSVVLMRLLDRDLGVLVTGIANMLGLDTNSGYAIVYLTEEATALGNGAVLISLMALLTFGLSQPDRVLRSA